MGPEVPDMQKEITRSDHVTNDRGCFSPMGDCRWAFGVRPHSPAARLSSTREPSAIGSLKAG
eukprot:15478696-Alexandrium_andersonii.AAC.1